MTALAEPLVTKPVFSEKVKAFWKMMSSSLASSVVFGSLSMVGGIVSVMFPAV